MAYSTYVRGFVSYKYSIALLFVVYWPSLIPYNLYKLISSILAIVSPWEGLSFIRVHHCTAEYWSLSHLF